MRVVAQLFVGKGGQYSQLGGMGYEAFRLQREHALDLGDDGGQLIGHGIILTPVTQRYKREAGLSKCTKVTEFG